MSTHSENRLLDDRIRAVWRRFQVLHLSNGILTFLRWAIPMFLVAIFIDRPAYLPSAVRTVMLVLLLALAFYKAWRAGWCRLEPFDATRAALQLEKEEGGLESLLVTAVQLREGKVSGISEALLQKISASADQCASSLKPQNTVPYQSLRKPGMLALVLAGTLIVVGVFDRPFLLTGLQRIFTPWVMVEYPTDTRLVINNADPVIRQGDEANIVMQISGVVPGQARLSLKTGTGRPRVRSLDITNGVCEYVIASASRDFTYRVHVGDTRSDWHRVKVIPSPQIKDVQAVLHFPAYLERAPETVSGLTLSVPEDTKIEWTLIMDRPLREARLLRDGSAPVPLSVSADGRKVTLAETATESRGYRFSWVEIDHGFDYTSPRHYLQVAPDQPPRIELTEPGENLIAILGRKVNFMIRARDDHGMAEANVAYRVNLRPQVSVALTTPIQNGGGDQTLDWDYRSAATNLQIGDTVAFTVEVRDRYEGPDGPHRAKSDTRRITFLSKEDYLAEIEKRKGRLLSRLRGIYRQERAAHEFILKLKPDSSGYPQTIQLESARQEMLRSQLNESVAAVQELIDDLAANGVSDAPEGSMLNELRTQLREVAEIRVAHAAGLLREQGNPTESANVQNPHAIANAIDLAARELGRLVLRRDIDSAIEVFAREIRAIAQNGAEFRRAAVLFDQDTIADSNSGQEERTALANGQRELAAWTRTLFSDIETGMQYTKRPLGVLNLTRRIKHLRQQGVASALDDTAELFIKGDVKEAMLRQSRATHAFLAAESRVRTGVEFTTLRTAHDQLIAIQNHLAGEAAADGQNQKTKLRQDLTGILLPEIPAPHSRLFDTTPAKKPDVDNLLQRAQRAMVTGGNAELAHRVMGELIGVVGARTEESLVETVGFGKVAGTLGEWAMQVTDFEARQIGLLEKTDLAAVEKKPSAPLLASQETITQELMRFQQDIRRENKTLNLSESDLAPMLGRLERAIKSMSGILAPLRENKHDAAIEQQDDASLILTDILMHTESQSERFAMLESLLSFERAVRKASFHVADIASEQRDILATIETSKAEDLPALRPAQANLRRCITELAPLLDLVAGQLDVGTPLAFSGADMEDAVESLGLKDSLDAVDALDAASESMESVTLKMLAMSRQVGYIAEVVDELNLTLGDTTFAAFDQEEIALALKYESTEIADGLLARQASLVGRSADLDLKTTLLAGATTNLIESSALVTATETAMKKKDAAAARDQSMQATEALNGNASGLLGIIKVLYGLPKLELTSETGGDHRRLMEALAVASDLHTLMRDTQAADPATVGALAGQQKDINQRCRAVGTDGSTHPKLVAAQTHLAKAVASIQTASLIDTLSEQALAGAALRHFIVEQALLLNTAVMPAAPADPDAPPSESGDANAGELAKAIGAVGDFVSGEVPKNQRSEWEMLKERSRAALHENFARELPLEYRGMLKSYFEGVAK